MKILRFILIIIVSSFGRHILSKKEVQQLHDRQDKVKAVVMDWIKKNAKYPNSYEAISFSDYSESYQNNGRIRKKKFKIVKFIRLSTHIKYWTKTAV